MYRLTLYVLISLVIISALESQLGILFFNAPDIILQALYLVIACNLANKILSKLFGAVTNIESALITALILSLIVGPLNLFRNFGFLTFLAFVAMASKYLLAFKQRHIFNPAAASIVITTIAGGLGASWWVGNLPLVPFALLGGILILAKIKRFTLALTFLAFYFILGGSNTVNTFLYSPIIFFTTIMLIEPSTSPVETKKQLSYAALVAISLFFYQKTLRVPYTFELALLTGNVFFYLVSKPFRAVFTLKEKRQIANQTYALSFRPNIALDFKPGQFMYWTLPHKEADARGVRRYFTIASSPTEKTITVAVRIPENPSSFKKALKNLKKDDEVVAMDIAGEFVLPEDKSLPLVFIAGGIGITPFASMAKWMMDKKEIRDIVLLCSNSLEEDISLKDIFDKAKIVGIKTHYIVTERDGYIDEKMIKEKVPDWQNRLFYISGSQPMVEAFKKMLAKMGVRKLKTDLFPGYTDKHQE